MFRKIWAELDEHGLINKSTYTKFEARKRKDE